MGVKKSQLVFHQEGGKRMTVLRRMTGEKKNKNSIFQNCWACCYGDEPPFHLFSLTYFLICCFCHMEGDYFLFHIFSVLFPHNGGLSQTPSVFLSQHPSQECVSVVSLCEEVWARPEADKLGGFEMTYVESFREKSRPLAITHPRTETVLPLNLRPAK